MPEIENQTFKDKVHGRIRGKYPDAKLDSEEDVYQNIDNYLNDQDKLNEDNASQISRYEESTNVLRNTLDRSDMARDLFAAMSRGENPVVMLVRKYGPDILESLQTDEGAKAYSDAEAEYRKKQDDDAAAVKEREDNLAKSFEALDAFQQEKNLTDEQTAAVFDKLWDMGMKAVQGNYDAVDFEMAYKALNYDSDVASAKEEGAIEGRNAKIAEKVKRSEKAKSMPTSMAGGNAEEPEVPKRREYTMAEDPFGVMRNR